MSRRFVHINEIKKIENEKSVKLREQFSCGKASLDDYIKTKAGQGSKQNLGQTHVFLDDSIPAICGYYTLSNLSIHKTRITAYFKFPLDEIPSMLIGRLAVSSSFQNQGIGKKLITNAFGKIVGISQDAGIKLIVVDALDEPAKDYYEKFGFKPFDDEPMKLYLAIETAKKAVAQV